MDAPTIEIVKVAMNAGALGMNFLILWMGFYLVNKFAQPLIDALNATAQSFGALKAKIDDVSTESKRNAKERKAP